MASKESDGRLRIPIALVVIALSITALFFTWRPEIELWFRISGSLMCAILLVWAVMILVGKTNSGKQLLDRRRWRYFSLISAFVAAGIVLAVIFTPDRYLPLTSALYPMLLGWVAAYLYEPGSRPVIKTPDNHKAGAWKKTAIVLAIVGVILGCIAGIAAVVGNIFVLALLLSIAIVNLITAAGLWTMVRSRDQSAKP